MFLGTYEPKLDQKGRLILPARFREQLAGGVVITRGQDHCLYVFTTAEFSTIYQQIRQAPLSAGKPRDFIRMMLSGASDEIPDRQGRITIPQNLRTYAHLERELAVIGAGSRVEIWDAEAWRAYLQSQEERFSETTEEVIPGLF